MFRGCIMLFVAFARSVVDLVDRRDRRRPRGVRSRSESGPSGRGGVARLVWPLSTDLHLF